MPRHAESFELHEEDFLKEYPVFDSLQFGEVDPPRWALRAIQKRGGHRHPKREVEQGSTSYSPSGIVGPFSPRPAHFHGHNLLPAHYRPKASDEQAILDKAMAKERRRNQARNSRNQVSQRKLVAVGNLVEDDYRYWKGFAITDRNANEGSCRWCEKLFTGRKNMLSHHSKGSCKQHLSALYRYAKHNSKPQRYCFACKKETDHSRWGIVMCDDVHCITRWKFNFNVQLPGYEQYRLWALQEQAKRGIAGPFGNLPPHDALAELDEYIASPC